MSALPRGVCPRCKRDVALRKDLTTREHRVRCPIGGGLPVCPGSGLVARGAGEAAAELLELARRLETRGDHGRMAFVIIACDVSVAADGVGDLLAMSVKSNVPGSVVAEVLGAAHDTVRADLDRAPDTKPSAAGALS